MKFMKKGAEGKKQNMNSILYNSKKKDLLFKIHFYEASVVLVKP